MSSIYNYSFTLYVKTNYVCYGRERLQDRGPGLALGHQLLRPVGRRAGQGPFTVLNGSSRHSDTKNHSNSNTGQGPDIFLQIIHVICAQSYEYGCVFNLYVKQVFSPFASFDNSSDHKYAKMRPLVAIYVYMYIHIYIYMYCSTPMMISTIMINMHIYIYIYTYY